jgi:hypothetical protein
MGIFTVYKRGRFARGCKSAQSRGSIDGNLKGHVETRADAEHCLNCSFSSSVFSVRNT